MPGPILLPDADDTDPMPARDDDGGGEPPSWNWDETKGGPVSPAYEGPVE